MSTPISPCTPEEVRQIAAILDDDWEQYIAGFKNTYRVAYAVLSKVMRLMATVRETQEKLDAAAAVANEGLAENFRLRDSLRAVEQERDRLVATVRQVEGEGERLRDELGRQRERNDRLEAESSQWRVRR